MPAISLHIGLNEFDPLHYGATGKLKGCENDARAMAQIAQAEGYQTRTLLTHDATSANVLGQLRIAAHQLQNGDIFLLTYAGHGSQIPDASSDEEDGGDETWCLFDRMLLDDELLAQWNAFAPGVRILIISDSCHSSSVARFYAAQQAENGEASYRTIPADQALSVYSKHQPHYESIKAGVSALATCAATVASVLSISGCQDNQTSADGSTNGLFTTALLAIWKSGAFQGSYRAFHRAIAGLMPPVQTPKLLSFGPASGAFLEQRPFQIPAAGAISFSQPRPYRKRPLPCFPI